MANNDPWQQAISVYQSHLANISDCQTCSFASMEIIFLASISLTAKKIDKVRRGNTSKLTSWNEDIE